jgi:hypothetical protein
LSPSRATLTPCMPGVARCVPVTLSLPSSFVMQRPPNALKLSEHTPLSVVLQVHLTDLAVAVKPNVPAIEVVDPIGDLGLLDKLLDVSSLLLLVSLSLPPSPFPLSCSRAPVRLPPPELPWGSLIG